MPQMLVKIIICGEITMVKLLLKTQYYFRIQICNCTVRYSIFRVHCEKLTRKKPENWFMNKPSVKSKTMLCVTKSFSSPHFKDNKPAHIFSTYNENVDAHCANNLTKKCKILEIEIRCLNFLYGFLTNFLLGHFYLYFSSL